MQILEAPASGLHWASSTLRDDKSLRQRPATSAPFNWSRTRELPARLGRLHMATRRFDAAEIELRHACTLKFDLPDLFTLRVRIA
jgi:hypothetical protein